MISDILIAVFGVMALCFALLVVMGLARKLGERPANDHASFSRAKSTKARAARVSERPEARTR